MNETGEKNHHPLELIFVGGIFLLFTVLFILSLFKIFGIPYGIDFGEGFLANMSYQLVSGANPYHSLDNPPWIVSSYPPLYPLLNGLLMLFTGPSLLPGRLIAAASLIGIATILILMLKHLKITDLVAFLAVALLLVFPWPFRWAQVVRVDTLGIFFAVSGLYVWLKGERKYGGVATAILFTLAVLTKHSFLAAPASVFVYSLLTKDPRIRKFIITFLITAVGGYFIINILTGGGLFLHLFTYTANRFFSERLTSGVGDYFASTWIIHLIALTAFLSKSPLSGNRSSFGWYYLLAHGTLLSYGFEGSDTNYLIEPLVSTLILSAFTIDSVIERNSESAAVNIFPVSLKAVIYTLLIITIINVRFFSPNDFRLHRMDPEKLQDGMELLQLVGASPGLVLSEDASFPFIEGKPVVFQPYIMSLLSRTGKWDQEPFLKTIRDQEYGLVILRVDLNDPYHTDTESPAYEMAGFNRWTDEMEQAILDNYELALFFDVGAGNYWYIYAPPEAIHEGQAHGEHDHVE
ncbi:MAG TPA: hypothetical protein VGB30_07425 [bacterium]|jgi:hypothetical protein